MGQIFWATFLYLSTSKAGLTDEGSGVKASSARVEDGGEDGWVTTERTLMADGVRPT